MTTTVKIHVNGRYRAIVKQTKVDGTVLPDVVIEGAYDRSPNPTGEMTFNLGHPATTMFEIVEEYLDAGDDPAHQEPVVEQEPVKEPLNENSDTL